MKISKEAEFILTQEEVSEILLDHMMIQGKLPEIDKESYSEVRTRFLYSPSEDVYKFTAMLEKGSIDE
jgi:hypothetical protein